MGPGDCTCSSGVRRNSRAFKFHWQTGLVLPDCEQRTKSPPLSGGPPDRVSHTAHCSLHTGGVRGFGIRTSYPQHRSVASRRVGARWQHGWQVGNLGVIGILVNRVECESNHSPVAGARRRTSPPGACRFGSEDSCVVSTQHSRPTAHPAPQAGQVSHVPRLHVPFSRYGRLVMASYHPRAVLAPQSQRQPNRTISLCQASSS